MPADDPQRRFYVVEGGLNMKGSCENSSCISVSYSLQDHIWLKKGYGIFNMAFIKNKNVCPGCQTPMEPASFKTFGYINAKVAIEGNKIDNYGGKFIKSTE
jgi:hypothetical protein